jgi:hypothetical protein
MRRKFEPSDDVVVYLVERVAAIPFKDIHPPSFLEAAAGPHRDRP